jgi:SAM-dependent methyltransferase
MMIEKQQVIYKNNIKEKIEKSNFIKLELGCGHTKKIKDAIGVDIVDLEDVDVVVNLNAGLPFENNTIDEIYSFHFLEHVEDLEFILKEIHRVLKINGKTMGTVPHFANPYFYSDPTHSNSFGLYTLTYYENQHNLFKRPVPNFYTSSLFQVSKIKLNFKSPFAGRYIFKRIIGFFVNLCAYTQEFHEENLCYIIPPYEIQFELEKA